VYNANPKATNKPVLDLSEAVVWNKKAVELYEWFVRDFPKDPKIPQAYFFLGYNYFEMANYEKGLSFYQKIVNEYPESDSALEARFSIGEYYFENEKFADALKQYGAFNDRKGHALYTSF
jgi:TolA-binding protein